MFERAHHQRIAELLSALDGSLLKEHRCYFGGGTAIALRYGEYRESVDVDFLVSDNNSYRELRQLARANATLAPFYRTGIQPFPLEREIRTDQYGIRAMLTVRGMPVKFEIVLEGRITLEIPETGDSICGVTTLTTVDMAASKLLANSDRWLDASVFSRDIIDLAMMNLPLPTLRMAIAKAEQAYGEAIVVDLEKAIARLADNPAILDRCVAALAINVPKAVLWNSIRKLRQARQTAS